MHFLHVQRKEVEFVLAETCIIVGARTVTSDGRQKTFILNIILIDSATLSQCSSRPGPSQGMPEIFKEVPMSFVQFTLMHNIFFISSATFFCNTVLVARHGCFHQFLCVTWSSLEEKFSPTSGSLRNAGAKYKVPGILCLFFFIITSPILIVGLLIFGHVCTLSPFCNFLHLVNM